MSASAPRNYWKPLIVCPHAAMSRLTVAALRELELEAPVMVGEYPRPGTMASLAAQQQVNICFLDVCSNQEEALLLISEAASVMPVVALNPENDADLILRCLRRGACEFLSDGGAEQLRGLLERLNRLRAPALQESPATVYCVVPGKAGCGASTLAVHLAVELKRGGAKRVLLVDADYLAASVGFLLRLKSDFHLDDAIRDCMRLDEDYWRNLVVAAQGIDVLTAPEQPVSPVILDRPAAVELVCFWREHYDAVVLDTPGAQEPGATLASLSDEILLVTTNELCPLHTTKRSLESLQLAGVEAGRIKLVVTRYIPATGLKSEDLKTALKLSPFALLSNDYEALQSAVLEGQPAPAASRFSRSVHDLAIQLRGKQPAPGKNGSGAGASKKPTSRFGWFSR
ncbi:MAG TPA: division plane positioning ATPase MipZ [Bryobacteraceae bacterium]